MTTAVSHTQREWALERPLHFQIAKPKTKSSKLFRGMRIHHMPLPSTPSGIPLVGKILHNFSGRVKAFSIRDIENVPHAGHPRDRHTLYGSSGLGNGS